MRNLLTVLLVAASLCAPALSQGSAQGSGKYKRLIARTDVKDLWAKYSGVATPRGEVWINGVVKDERSGDYKLKITTINGPISR